MDRDTIIQLAREAAFHTPVMEAELIRFVALVAAHEREACAQVCIELGKEAELASGIPPTRFTAAAKTLREHAVAHYTAARYIRKRDDQRTI